MRTNNYSNPFQYASGDQQSVLKGRKATPRQAEPPQQPVYYAPVMIEQPRQAAASATSANQPSKGLLGQLKEKIWHMISEETSGDRPIGISQLTRKTFSVRQEVANDSFFRNGQTLQDYRFSQLTRS